MIMISSINHNIRIMDSRIIRLLILWEILHSMDISRDNSRCSMVGRTKTKGIRDSRSNRWDIRNRRGSSRISSAVGSRFVLLCKRVDMEDVGHVVWKYIQRALEKRDIPPVVGKSCRELEYYCTCCIVMVYGTL